jgi:PAS domain S-box-containing protein
VDLVVMDYRLGTTTGLDLHRRMKAGGVDTPVIIVSGAMDDRTIIEAIRGGVRDVIVKSTDYLDYLPDAVRAVLRQTAAVADKRPHERSTATVLVVEDDPGVATLEKRQLERAGYDVELATTAEEALEAVTKGGISVAILDLRLPGTASGIDLYERMKVNGWQLPAILVTGFPDQAVAIRALRAGIRDFIPKSSDYLEYLPAAVDRVVSQVRVERKLVDSELRLASIIATTMDAILMCDEHRRIVLFNRSAEEMFRCSAADATNRPLDSFIPGLALVDTARDAAPPQAGSLQHRTEVDAIRPDGTRLPIEVSISDVVVHGKRLFTVIARDVSERRRIEAELRDADRRKDEFLGMLAHELRNPLAAIMGAGEVLHQTVQGPHAQKLTTVVTRQTRALARMVDDLLDVSRVTLGKIRLATEPLVLSQVVSRAADNLRESVTKAGLQLEIQVDPEPVWVHGDPTRLDQVLANLVGNAVKFTPPGGRITIAGRREGHNAVIRVRDTGIGMDPALLPNVFELFVQGDTSLARSKSGLGIGLALVRQVVALHRGQVTAFSEGPGTGSEFIVRLPAAVEEAGPAEDERETAVPLHAPMRILVVDDQPDVADAMALLMESLGHETRAAYSAMTALATTQSNPPDVMFVDIGMPGMNGYDLARHVRGDRRLADVQLVALTGYGRDEDRARALEAGFDLHLTKPVVDSRLQEVLATLATSVKRTS